MELAHDAVILTYTTVHTVPEGFTAPIHLVLVGLEKGAKLMCESKDGAGMEIGVKGKVVVEEGKNYFVR